MLLKRKSENEKSKSTCIGREHSREETRRKVNVEWEC